MVGVEAEVGYAEANQEGKEMTSEAQLRAENARLRKALKTALDELYPGQFPPAYRKEADRLLGAESPWTKVKHREQSS